MSKLFVFVLQEMLHTQQVELCSSQLKHKSVESITGLTTLIENQSWPSLEVTEGLPEGRGVFATSKIDSGSMVCNYGGVLLNKHQGNIIPEEDSNYLMELTVFPGEHTFFLNHTMDSEFTYGKYINHSSKHPNVRPKVFLKNGLPEVIFFWPRKKFFLANKLHSTMGDNSSVLNCVCLAALIAR